jgi:DNA anti-recombination protein RmuC
MPEGNGTGRLDRIEALLEKTGEHLEATAKKMEQLAHSVYLYEGRVQYVEDLHAENEERWKRHEEEQRERDKQAEAERKRLDQLWENTDKRIATLVSSIGELIKRLPIPAEPAE